MLFPVCFLESARLFAEVAVAETVANVCLVIPWPRLRRQLQCVPTPQPGLMWTASRVAIAQSWQNSAAGQATTTPATNTAMPKVLIVLVLGKRMMMIA